LGAEDDGGLTLDLAHCRGILRKVLEDCQTSPSDAHHLLYTVGRTKVLAADSLGGA
jgi:hypothetical protein